LAKEGAWRDLEPKAQWKAWRDFRVLEQRAETCQESWRVNQTVLVFDAPKTRRVELTTLEPHDLELMTSKLHDLEPMI